MGGFCLLIRLIHFTGHSSFAVPLRKTFTTEDTEEAQGTASTLDILFEHFFGVDGDEDAAAAGQDFIFFV
jgi:hypothetical protein